MTSRSFETSLAEGGLHHALQRLVGEWEGVTRTWFEPDTLADESPCRGTVRAVLGGRFVVHEYEGSLQGKPLAGMALLGYHLDQDRYEVAWVDTFHCGTFIMFSTGAAPGAAPGTSTGQGPNVRGSYSAPSGPPWGWRTEVQLPEPDRLVITHFNIPPEGEGPEARAVETVYRRRGG